MMSPWSSSTPLTEAAEWVQLLFCVFGLKKKKPAVSQLQIAHDFISLISGVSGPVPASRLWCGLPLRAVPLWYQHMLEDPCCLPKISLQTSLEGGKEKNIKDTKIQCWKKQTKKNWSMNRQPVHINLTVTITKLLSHKLDSLWQYRTRPVLGAEAKRSLHET